MSEKSLFFSKDRLTVWNAPSPASSKSYVSIRRVGGQLRKIPSDIQPLAGRQQANANR